MIWQRLRVSWPRLDSAIHVFFGGARQDVDAPDKRGGMTRVRDSEKRFSEKTKSPRRVTPTGMVRYAFGCPLRFRLFVPRTRRGMQ
jgi:hypothetical protein